MGNLCKTTPGREGARGGGAPAVWKIDEGAMGDLCRPRRRRDGGEEEEEGAGAEGAGARSTRRRRSRAQEQQPFGNGVGLYCHLAAP